MGHDQACDRNVGKRAVEQSRPGGDRLLVAEAGIHHRPAVAVGEQIDVDVVEAERKLEPDPQYPRHDLDRLIRAGMMVPWVAQGLGRGRNHVGL